MIARRGGVSLPIRGLDFKIQRDLAHFLCIWKAAVPLVQEEVLDDPHGEPAHGGFGEVEIPHAGLVTIELLHGHGGEECWICEPERVGLVEAELKPELAGRSGRVS